MSSVALPPPRPPTASTAARQAISKAARLSRGPASVWELARPLSISLPAVLQHVQALEASGLVRSEKKGRVRTCRLEPKALGAAEAWIAEQRALWEGRLDRLEDFLVEMQAKEKAR